MMLAKAKVYAMAAIGILLAVFSIFRAGGKSATAKIKAKAEGKAREVEHVGYEAAEAGRVKEQEIRKEEVDPKAARNFFE